MVASTNPFGQSLSSPFGSSQSVFGQQNNSSNNPFAPKPIGSQTPLGSQTGNSSTSPGVFGATQTLSPFSFNTTSSASSSSAFSKSMPAFGVSYTPSFGNSWSSYGGTPSAFGDSSSPAFGASSTPAFSFGSPTQAFGQSSSAFATSSPFGGTNSAFGESHTPTQTFENTGIGQSEFGCRRGGSRVASYSATTQPDGGSTGQLGKFECISTMSIYNDKSHEELRWEDYQLGDKGGPLASAPQSTGMAGFNSSTTQTTSAHAFSSPAFSISTSAAASSIFGPSKSPFGANSSSRPVGSSTSIGANSSSRPVGASMSSPFGSPPLFRSPPLFSSNAPTNPQSGSAFAQTAPSMSTSFQSAQPAQSSDTFTLNFDKTQPGTQTPTQAFAIGKSEFRGQRGGSRVASYSPTFTADTPPIQTEKLESISAIPLYKDKSHEELRLEDYQLGSSAPTNAQSGSEFGQNTFPFGQTAGFRQSSFFGSHSSRLVGSIFSSMASLTSNAPSLATSMASLTSNAPSLAILTGTVVVTVVVTRWISLRSGRA